MFQVVLVAMCREAIVLNVGCGFSLHSLLCPSLRCMKHAPFKTGYKVNKVSCVFELVSEIW